MSDVLKSDWILITRVHVCKYVSELADSMNQFSISVAFDTYRFASWAWTQSYSI